MKSSVLNEESILSRVITIFFCILFFSLNVSAETNFMTRVTKVDCQNKDHQINIILDSAMSPIGPIKFLFNGKDIAPGMRITIEKGNAIYESRGLKITLDEGDVGNKKFIKTVSYRGRKISLECTHDSRLRFFRNTKVYDKIPQSSDNLSNQ